MEYTQKALDKINGKRTYLFWKELHAKVNEGRPAQGHIGISTIKDTMKVWRKTTNPNKQIIFDAAIELLKAKGIKV
tara:strand:- start:172 stop:399 length:228 start_codon:yes stop_codon:yes gene_type:complete